MRGIISIQNTELDIIEEGLVLKYISEKDHQEAFVGWKRSGCFVHTSRLVVKIF